MSFADRFWDDDGFGVADSDLLIPVVADLLARLGLLDAARNRQEAGIRDWLRSHTPSRNLIRSIELEGYAEALDELRPRVNG